MKILLYWGSLSLNSKGVPLKEKTAKIVCRGLVKSATIKDAALTTCVDCETREEVIGFEKAQASCHQAQRECFDSAIQVPLLLAFLIGVFTGLSDRLEDRSLRLNRN